MATILEFLLVLQFLIIYMVRIKFLNFPNYPLLNLILIWYFRSHLWNFTHIDCHSIFRWFFSILVSRVIHECVKDCFFSISNMQFHLKVLHSHSQLPIPNYWQYPWSISTSVREWLPISIVNPYHVKPTQCWWGLHLECRVQ